ncbi:MAG: hypothetical protein ACI9ZF_000951 [Bradyrhizobium sp.]|jgi:hypothetical protein
MQYSRRFDDWQGFLNTTAACLFFGFVMTSVTAQPFGIAKMTSSGIVLKNPLLFSNQ